MNSQNLKKLLNGWVITGKIGKGSFGEVYRAEKTVQKKTVRSAVKLISVPKPGEAYPGPEEDAPAALHAMADRLCRELDQIAEIRDSAHIVQCRAHSTAAHADGSGWDMMIRMDLLTPLNAYYRSKRSIDSGDIIQLGKDLCMALEEAGSRGLTHGDIKPGNILVNAEGTYMLGDFGISRILSAAAPKTAARYAYAAPERVRGGNTDERSDLYSLGMVMYRYLNANRLPFCPAYPAEVGLQERQAAFYRRMRGESLPPPADAEGELSGIILKACAFDPDDRYRTAGELYEALDRLARGDRPGRAGARTEREPARQASGQETGAKERTHRPEESGQAPGKKKSRSVLPLILGILVVAALAAAGYLAWKNGLLPQFKAGQETEEPIPENAGILAAEAEAGAAGAPDAAPTAMLSEYTDESGREYYNIKVNAPAGSKVRVITSEDIMTQSVTVPKNNQVILRVEKEIIMPNEPVESETVTFSPKIEIETPDGRTLPVETYPITVQVPSLSLEMENPEESLLHQTISNDPFQFLGTVSDPDASVFVNGEPVNSYNSLFVYEYKPVIPPRTENNEIVGESGLLPVDSLGLDSSYMDPSGRELIIVEARKNNYKTARITYTIDPYIIHVMQIRVDENGLSDSYGNITITGTLSAGTDMHMTAECAARKVQFGSPVILPDGTFSLTCKAGETGVFSVTLTAGANEFLDGSASFLIERPPRGNYTQYLGQCKNLDKQMAKVLSGDVTTGNFYTTGAIAEILETQPHPVFRLTTPAGDVICVNRSETPVSADLIGKTYKVAGSLSGLYAGEQAPLLYAWHCANQGK